MEEQGQNNDTSGRCEVWECRPADTFYAMHHVLLVDDGGAQIILDPELSGPARPAWEATSAVDTLLAVAGFSGKRYGLMELVERKPGEITLFKIRGFRAAAGSRGAIVAAVKSAVTGDTGGFWPLVLDTTGFNTCAIAFEAAWEAAGKPPIVVVHPNVGTAEGKGGSIDVATSQIDFVRIEYDRHALELPGSKSA